MDSNHQKIDILDLADFTNFCEKVQNLPYKRNFNKVNIYCVIDENGGTCSTKHALLKFVADSNNIAAVQLYIGIFLMNALNTPKIATVLQKYSLTEMPEAHSYLKINGTIHDYTRKNSNPQNFVNDLVTEIEIQPDQITDFKVEFHQNYLNAYLEQRPEIHYSFAEFLKIREECIAELQR